MLEKVSYIAEYEGRSVNSHVLFLVRNNIEAFEDKHGTISGKISPDKNIKISR